MIKATVEQARARQPRFDRRAVDGSYHWINHDDSPVWLLAPFEKAVEAWNAQNDPGDQNDLTLERLGSES
jgi:hypothetical protein